MNYCNPSHSHLRWMLSQLVPDGVTSLAEDEEIEVRLQVTERGYMLWNGDPQYDTDHRGFWGAGVITRGTDLSQLASELLQEVDDSMAQELL